MSTTTIETAEGRVRGRREGAVLRWRAIPFAAPPVAELRFRAPQPMPEWAGVRDATVFAFAAMQHRTGAQLGRTTFQPVSEDCLTLNVTAPAEPSTTPRPVMVFFHGGGNSFGTSALAMYSGTELVRRGDVLVVSCNYRLGVFGFTDFSEYGYDSNLGLRDQVAALEWVQRNIAAFGGDPGNVTVFGESAGALGVTTLLATPAAKGLFHRAIAQSPPADWALDADTARRLARELLDEAGIDPADLGTIEARELGIAAAKAGLRVTRETPGFFVNASVVDGEFLPEAPLSAYRAGRTHPVPLIAGTCDDEGMLFARFLDQLPTNPKRIERMFDVIDPAYRDRVIAAYPGYPDRRAAIRLGGDRVFWLPTLRVVEGHSQVAPTYHYRYDYAPMVVRRLGIGATHATDLLAVFGLDWLPAATAASYALDGFRTVRNEVQGHWLAFASSGTPRDNWPAYTTASRKTLVINKKSTVQQDARRERRLAWSGFGSRYAADRTTAA